MFYPTLVTIHSVFRWLVVILLLAAIVNALVRRLENKAFGPFDYRLSLFAIRVNCLLPINLPSCGSISSIRTLQESYIGSP